MAFYMIFCACTVYGLLPDCHVVQGLGNTLLNKQLLCSRVIFPFYYLHTQLVEV